MTVATLVATEHCDGLSPSDTVRDVGRPPTGKTFIARARVKRAKWDRFEAAARVMGTDRSKLINDFVDWVLRERGAVLPERPSRAAVDAYVAAHPDEPAS